MGQIPDNITDAFYCYRIAWGRQRGSFSSKRILSNGPKLNWATPGLLKGRICCRVYGTSLPRLEIPRDKRPTGAN